MYYTVHTCVYMYHIHTCYIAIYFEKLYKLHVQMSEIVEMLKNSKKVDYSTLQDLNQIFYEGVHMYHQRITLQH